MRDVNNGWAIRYTHANVASFFFIFVYAHIARGLYYGSYKAPRVLLWAIGVIILIVMMAKMWPNWNNELKNFIEFNLTLLQSPLMENETLINIYIDQIENIIPIIGKMLPINKQRTKAILRIGPHDKQVLDIIISGMLGDFWADKIKGKSIDSIRFNIEQSISNTAYIHYLTLLFYKWGYCHRPLPTLVKKSDKIIENRFNYRLTLFTFTSFNWIYLSFYKTVNGVTKKCVPYFIEDYLSPIGLAHWLMLDGSFQKGQGVYIACNSFTYDECLFLARILTRKYNLKTSVIKTGTPNQFRISIWKNSMPVLRDLVKSYFIPEMEYKLGSFY